MIGNYTISVQSLLVWHGEIIKVIGGHDMQWKKAQERSLFIVKPSRSYIYKKKANSSSNFSSNWEYFQLNRIKMSGCMKVNTLQYKTCQHIIPYAPCSFCTDWELSMAVWLHTAPAGLNLHAPKEPRSSICLPCTYKHPAWALAAQTGTEVLKAASLPVA